MRLVAAVCVLSAATAYARPQPVYRPTAPAPIAQGVSHVIYLNNCEQLNGCLVRPGPDDARADTSSIPTALTTISPFAFSDETWRQVVDCVTQVYAPFDVQIVTARPATGSYHMAIVAGRPQEVALGSAGGISPFTCGYIPNSISFTFANIYEGDVDQICWTVAQETAHAWGLDHKFDNRDPMTYLGTGPWRKTFQHEAGSCGEFRPRPCNCPYPDTAGLLDSYGQVLATFGPSKAGGPAVVLASPAEGATVAAGFAIQADIAALDASTITAVELRIDGQLVSTLAQAPWVWAASDALGQGNHALKVTAYDAHRRPGSAQIRVTLGTACHAAADCAVASQTCVDERCVAGDPDEAGLGAACTTAGECASNQCAVDFAGRHRCVESCDPALVGCPSGFECVAPSNVCWSTSLPAPPSGGGGCNTSGGRAWIGVGVAALCVMRKRRFR